MGKKKIVQKGESGEAAEIKSSPSGSKKLSKKRLDSGVLHVRSTYNNTTLLLTDQKGNAISSTSSGALGFKGAKKGTPFAATKAAEVLAERAEGVGIKKVNVVVKGVGAGRESAIRGFINKGIQLMSLKDMTPVPHNGPQRRKPRRV